MPIYTKTGDYGETDLYGGTRVRKSVEVVEVLGELDELNAFLGLTRLYLRKSDSQKMAQIQNDLFIVGSVVAGASFSKNAADYLKKQVVLMEKGMDVIDRKLPVLKNFILPNGCESSARLHLARAICRRCERSLVALRKHSALVPYINRLSDYLFILARFENHRHKVKDAVFSLDLR